jgi:hypothetical protein
LQISVEFREADVRTLLDTFNDRWVLAARFLSSRLLMELLRLTREWTPAYYEGVDRAAMRPPHGGRVGAKNVNSGS